MESKPDCGASTLGKADADVEGRIPALMRRSAELGAIALLRDYVKQAEDTGTGHAEIIQYKRLVLLGQTLEEMFGEDVLLKLDHADVIEWKNARIIEEAECSRIQNSQADFCNFIRFLHELNSKLAAPLFVNCARDGNGLDR